MKVDIRAKGNLEKILNYRGKIYYGVPSETATKRKPAKNLDKDKPTYNNAQILQLMEHGSPINGIPRRELLRPVIKKYRPHIMLAMAKVIKYILKDNIQMADVEMQKLALRLESWCKKFFTDEDNNWAPNAPITIDGGWMRNKVTGKPIYIKGKKSDKPLIDTGSLRQSIKAFFNKD